MAINRFMISVAIILTQTLSMGCEEKKDNFVAEELIHEKVKFSSVDLNRLSSNIQDEPSAFIYITTNWCRGGALTMNSYVLPKMNEIEGNWDSVYLIYFGKSMSEDLRFDTLQSAFPITIHQIDDSFLDNALVHKWRISSFLKDLDSEYIFKNSIPVSVFYNHGRLHDCYLSQQGIELKN